MQELAERLRAGINVVYQHYIVQNPLLQEAKAKKIYRDKLKPKDADEESLELIAKLESLNPGNKNLLKQFRDTITRRIIAKGN